jgi:hypothetical protein
MTIQRRCSAREQRLDRDVQALRIENDLLAATVLLDKGADIYRLIYKPRDWDHTIVEAGGEAAEVRLTTRLFRSPFRIERTMRVEVGTPVLLLREQITNEGGEPIDYMWGHHPGYGPPFLSDACRIDIGARALRADDIFDGPYNPLAPGRRYDWPIR